MGEAVIDVFGIGIDFNRHRVGGFRVGGEVAADLVERFDECAGGLLARFDPRLVIRIHVHQRGVETHRPLEQCDQQPKLERRHLGDGNGERLAPGLVQCPARAAEKALQVIRGGGAGLDLDAVTVAALPHFDERDKEIVHAIAELLDVGVLVGRALVSINGDALVDDLAVEVVLLA